VKCSYTACTVNEPLHSFLLEQKQGPVSRDPLLYLIYASQINATCCCHQSVPLLVTLLVTEVSLYKSVYILKAPQTRKWKYVPLYLTPCMNPQKGVVGSLHIMISNCN